MTSKENKKEEKMVKSVEYKKQHVNNIEN